MAPSFPRPEYDQAFDDAMLQPEVQKQTDPMVELGLTGLRRSTGYVDEEFLPALRGRKAVQVYREMSNNDSIVGAMLFTIEQLLKGVEFKVTPPDQSEEGKRAADFLESCKDDMSHSWGDFITEVLSCLVYGWSWHEIVYKKRVGPWQKDPKMKSKYTDGLIGWRKIPIRAQETMTRWVFDETGGIQAMVQMAPPTYATKVIPIHRSLLFRTSQSKGNPEGKSILRTAYRSWYMKKRLEEYEAIGVERDLAGMPVARVPHDYLSKDASPEKKAMVTAFRKMVRGVRRDENEGIIMPSAFDPDTKQQMFEFELMSSGGTRQFDTNGIISRYEQRILMATLADFILVGHEGTGSYSMHTDKTGIFRAAINSIAEMIADVLNRHAVPRLFEANAWKLPELPKFEPMNVDPPDLQQLAAFISATSAAGMQWFPDPDLEKAMRDYARLPEMNDETLEFKRQQFEAEQAMGAAESQMGILGLKQKAEMAAQGYTPEQAEQAAQAPNADMVAQEQAAQLDADEALAQHPARLRQQEQETAMQQGGPEPSVQTDEAIRQKASEAEIDEQREQAQHGRQMTMEQFKAQQAERQARMQAKKQGDDRKPPAKKAAPPRRKS